MGINAGRIEEHSLSPGCPQCLKIGASTTETEKKRPLRQEGTKEVRCPRAKGKLHQGGKCDLLHQVLLIGCCRGEMSLHLAMQWPLMTLTEKVALER